VRDVLKAYFDKKARRQKIATERETAQILAPLRLLASPFAANLSFWFPEGLPQ
jgi:hypothetical protein